MRPEACSILPTIGARLVVGELVRGRELDREAALRAVDDRLELLGDRAELAGAALLRDEPDEVADERVAAGRRPARGRWPSRAGSSCGLARNAWSSGSLERARRARRGSRDGVDAVLLLRRLEEGARVHALRDGHQFARALSSAEKSRPWIASSTRRRWSSRRAPCRRRAAVASIVRSATSLRIWPIARDGLRVDLLARLLEPALPLLLGLVLHALDLRVRDLPGLGEDVGGLGAGLGEDRAVLLEQLPCLVARVVGLLDRLADAVAAVVDGLLDRAERELPEDEERDREAISVQIMSPGTTLIRAFEDSAASRPTMSDRGRTRAVRR